MPIIFASFVYSFNSVTQTCHMNTNSHEIKSGILVENSLYLYIWLLWKAITALCDC